MRCCMFSIEKVCNANPLLTDIHVTEGEVAAIRVLGTIKKGKEIIGKEFFEEILFPLCPSFSMDRFQRSGSFDGAMTLSGKRFRVHVYKTFGLMACSLRLLPSLEQQKEDPDMAWIEKVSELSQGLVLFVGPAGSGKSTAMARTLSLINEKRSCHVVTLEDPIEYLFSSGKALIHQREVGRDVPSFASGIRDAMREDLDVLMIGELRDKETVAAALSAAESGHLVISTLHSATAKEATARLIQLFPGERQSEIRSLLASSLRYVAAQRLWTVGKERILLREILSNTPAVSHLIREGKEEQVSSYMEMGLHQMRTLKQAVYGLKTVSEKEREKLLKMLES